MRGFAGYSFKPNFLTEAQQIMLDNCLMAFPDTDNASEWKIDNKVYLFCPTNGTLVIFGVGLEDVTPTASDDGIMWGANYNNVYQMLQYIDIAGNKIFSNAYPYKVEPNTIYCIENGSIYGFLCKGERVSTPQGNGVVKSIDDLHDTCVELDEDKEVYYEFSVKEIRKIKHGE